MSERWKPEDTYYFIDSIGMVGIHRWCDDSVDNAYYESGNCFRTEAEAIAASKEVKALLLGFHGEHAAECSKLPKLTTEVFDREDCPKWARYAAVDLCGVASYYEEKPYIANTYFRHSIGKYWVLSGKFDDSDWQNSLIERPYKKPEWCKFGVVGWHKRAGYFTVCADDELAQRISIQQIGDKSRGWLSYETLCEEAKQARLRPYNADEMKELVGKVIDTPDGYLFVDAYSKRDSNIHTADGWFYSDYLLHAGYIINGNPCGVYEHLNDKGEWVA